MAVTVFTDTQCTEGPFAAPVGVCQDEAFQSYRLDC